MSQNPTPLFQVLHGQPTAEECAALQLALEQLIEQARRAAHAADAERNCWGMPLAQSWNPRAFHTTAYY